VAGAGLGGRFAPIKPANKGFRGLIRLRQQGPYAGGIESQRGEPAMLFVCYVTIDPEHRDESIKRFKHKGIVEPKGVKLVGAWISLSQQETWSIFEADDAAAIMALFEPWTDLNLHHIAPVMDFAELKDFVKSA
jgi:hypothetical protein